MKAEEQLGFRCLILEADNELEELQVKKYRRGIVRNE
jgi:hypothetical protein